MLQSKNIQYGPPFFKFLNLPLLCVFNNSLGPSINYIRTLGEGGAVKFPIYFYCVLHAKSVGGEGGPDSMEKCVLNQWKAPFQKWNVYGFHENHDARLNYV